MQTRNRSTENPPKAGDGTLQEPQSKPEANWFGPSQEPQEEYINNGIDEVGPIPEKSRPQRDPAARTMPLAPSEVFPFGDPSSQSDG